MFYLNKWDLNGNTKNLQALVALLFYLNKWDLNSLGVTPIADEITVLSEQVGFKPVFAMSPDDVEVKFYLNKWDLNLL